MALYDSLFGMMDLQAAQASLVLLMLVDAPCFALAAVAKPDEHVLTGSVSVSLSGCTPCVSLLDCACMWMSLVTQTSPPKACLLQVVVTRSKAAASVL